MIKFLAQAASTLLLALVTLLSASLLAQECATFDFASESGEVTFLADIDRCGADVTWDEPVLTNGCDLELTVVTNLEQGQYLETGYHMLTYQAFDENELLVGQSELYLDVFDNKVPVPQGDGITQDNPIEYPQYFDGPEIYLEGDFDMSELPLYLALDNCAGEVEGEITVLELDADARSITWYFSDGVFTSELNILVFSNVDMTSSIDESASFSDAKEKIEMLIFPNPMVDKSTVKLDSQFSNKYEVTVYSMTGKIVYSDEFVNGENQLDAEFLPSGIYTIHVKSGASSKIERFIKK